MLGKMCKCLGINSLFLCSMSHRHLSLQFYCVVLLQNFFLVSTYMVWILTVNLTVRLWLNNLLFPSPFIAVVQSQVSRGTYALISQGKYEIISVSGQYIKINARIHKNISTIFLFFFSTFNILLNTFDNFKLFCTNKSFQFKAKTLLILKIWDLNFTSPWRTFFFFFPLSWAGK